LLDFKFFLVLPRYATLHWSLLGLFNLRKLGQTFLVFWGKSWVKFGGFGVRGWRAQICQFWVWNGECLRFFFRFELEEIWGLFWGQKRQGVQSGFFERVIWRIDWRVVLKQKGMHLGAYDREIIWRANLRVILGFWNLNSILARCTFQSWHTNAWDMKTWN
jgi:hypothetical protein